MALLGDVSPAVTALLIGLPAAVIGSFATIITARMRPTTPKNGNRYVTVSELKDSERAIREDMKDMESNIEKQLSWIVKFLGERR